MPDKCFPFIKPNRGHSIIVQIRTVLSKNVQKYRVVFRHYICKSTSYTSGTSLVVYR